MGFFNLGEGLPALGFMCLKVLACPYPKKIKFMLYPLRKWLLKKRESR